MAPIVVKIVKPTRKVKSSAAGAVGVVGAVFKAGLKCIYKGNETVTVLEAHHDDPDEVFYTVRLPDGSERQTTAGNLQLVEDL
jgi:hypothetical protein